MQALYQPQVQIRAAQMCNRNWLQGSWKGALGYQTTEVPRTWLGAPQFGTVKERCWQSEPGASSQARSRRRGRARQHPEGQRFNIDAESCTLLGKGKTKGNVVSICYSRDALQNYKCYYFALHLYLTDRNTHTPRWEIGATLITCHLQTAPRVLAGSGVHLACSIQTSPWPETSRHDQIQLHWEDAPERTGGEWKGNTQLRRMP